MCYQHSCNSEVSLTIITTINLQTNQFNVVETNNTVSPVKIPEAVRVPGPELTGDTVASVGDVVGNEVIVVGAIVGASVSYQFWAKEVQEPIFSSFCNSVLSQLGEQARTQLKADSSLSLLLHPQASMV